MKSGKMTFAQNEEQLHRLRGKSCMLHGVCGAALYFRMAMECLLWDCAEMQAENRISKALRSC